MAGLTQTVRKKRRTLPVLGLCAVGILINLLGSAIVEKAGLPLYLDSAGTIIAAALGGYLPGIAAGLLTNLFKTMLDPSAIFYSTVNVLIAVMVAFFSRRGWLKKPATLIYSTLLLALICGGLSSILTWALYGFSYDGISAPLALYFCEHGLSPFLSQFCADLLIDLADKVISILLLLLVLKLVPQSWQVSCVFDNWRQAPLSDETKSAALKLQCRGTSLRVKILILISVASVSLGVVATSISYLLYRNYSIEVHTLLGQGVANLAISVIDPERVDDFIALGESADGYLETEKMLYSVRDSSPDIEYVYVYRILEDGCHVVFDLDTEEVAGDEPGDVIPFDETFLPYLPKLLAGEKIDPIISDDSFGWLLTVYEPVYNSQGECVCYAAADISMNQLSTNSYGFLAKQVSLFLGFFILILAIGLWLAEYHVTLPINSMAMATGGFAYNSEEARADSLERIQELDIHTGDEIENLYLAIAKTTGDTMQYITDVQEKSEVIEKMQSGLIMVLADLVESRDKCTGDHVRKTAAYARIIMAQMRKEGIYPQQMTDKFVDDVSNCAPLHDVGKITVSDTILNKPGRLTDEEFQIMKNHTVAGGEIIESAISQVSESGYLDEARRLATYHHERWDGKGYPEGLSGEDIPLSARIMAVADVFDALVSKRSYKEGFPFEKAMEIMREGSGTQFDPNVLKAFLDAEDQVRQVAEEHKRTYE